MSISMEPLLPLYHLQAGVVSEKGTGRDTNEDAYRLDLERGLFLIADGMGGHQAGEVASRVAIDVLYETLTASDVSSKDDLVTALLAAHTAIRSMAQENEAYRGMGTTALIGWVRIPELLLWTAHIGNSRAYLWRDGTLQQLTDDHTLLNELRKANRLPPDPKDWPSPAILTQALGSNYPYLSPGLGEWSLQIGDRLLFCSDGISDLLAVEELNGILGSQVEPQMVCEQLAQSVRNKGARDDYTAIVVYIKPKEHNKATNTIQIKEVEKR